MKSDKQTQDLFGCIGLFAVLPLVAVLRGFILTQLWAWYLVPLFHIPQIAVLEAIGLSYIVTFFQGTPQKSETDWGYTFVAAFIGPLLTWGFAFIVHLLMH